MATLCNSDDVIIKFWTDKVLDLVPLIMEVIQNRVNNIQFVRVIQLVIQTLKLVLLIRKRLRIRRWWVKPHILAHVRFAEGAYNNLFCYFKLQDEEEFYEYTRMSVLQFTYLSEITRDALTKISLRPPLEAELKLVIVLNFLAHGGQCKNLSTVFRIGKSTIYKIIQEVCTVLWNVLKPIYLRKPDQAMWLSIINKYQRLWNFPNCLGALDGKHFKIKKLPRMGNVLYNYKKFQSIVLLATCDADKRFTWISLGDYGTFSDTSIFNHSKLYRNMLQNRLDLPASQCLPGTNEKFPYVFVGDEIFPLLKNLMKPFPRHNQLTIPQKIFNYRLSRARLTIECAFGILLSKWTILQNSLNFQMSTCQSIIGACICLHNFLLSDNLRQNEAENYHMDNEPQVLHEADEQLQNEAVLNRLTLVNYFVEEVAVPWQHLYIQ